MVSAHELESLVNGDSNECGALPSAIIFTLRPRLFFPMPVRYS